jgi:hypothetical protein
MVHKRFALRLHIQFLQLSSLPLTIIREDDTSFILHHLDMVSWIRHRRIACSKFWI